MDVYSTAIIQPPLAPPPILFPIVWGILYALMGFSAARIYLSAQSAERSKGINLYIAQLVVNFFWSLIFFNAQAFGFAFFWLLLLLSLAVWMAVSFGRVNKTAGVLQIPYILWLLFAGYLNLAVYLLNG